MDVCKEIEPSFLDVGGNHFVACWLYEPIPSSYSGPVQAAATD
jgi:hypothetical protein